MLQKTLEAYKTWHAIHEKFPRLSKFSIGSKIDALFADLIELLLRAGYAATDQKHPLIISASTKLDALKLFLQTAWELRCMDHKQFASLTQPLNETGKMLGGWQRSLQEKRPASMG